MYESRPSPNMCGVIAAKVYDNIDTRPRIAPKDDLPKSFHQHHVVDRRIGTGVEDRAAVARRRQSETHSAEVSSNQCGRLAGQIEVFEPVLAADPFEVV